MKHTKQTKFNWSTFLIIILITFTLAAIVVGIVLCKITPKEIMNTYEIIMIAVNIYSSLSLLLLVVQLIVSKQDTRARHDEKRREKTVDYMVKWSESLSWETAYALKVVETFNHQQCMSLYNNIPFEVDYHTKENLCPICSRYLKDTCNKCMGKSTDNQSGENSDKEKLYTIDAIQCAEIRWYVIKYLNHLEALLISWKEGIVDREIIEEQFCYLYDPSSGRDTLQSFRNIAGDGKSYPTIEEFCLELRNNRQQTNNKIKELL